MITYKSWKLFGIQHEKISSSLTLQIWLTKKHTFFVQKEKLYFLRMSNIDQSGIEDEHQKGSASFRSRNKELYTRDNPINKGLPIDSVRQNVAQKLPVPSQVVENLSHSSGSSLSLEGMEFTL